MELLLNLVWLFLALASVTLWYARWRHALLRGDERKQALRSAVGLMCVLTLMFFAISMTDDLHPVPALAEDSAKARLKCGVVVSADNHLVQPALAFGAPSVVADLTPQSADEFVVESYSPPDVTSLFSLPSGLRAPPRSSF